MKPSASRASRCHWRRDRGRVGVQQRVCVCVGLIQKYGGWVGGLVGGWVSASVFSTGKVFFMS